MGYDLSGTELTGICLRDTPIYPINVEYLVVAGGGGGGGSTGSGAALDVAAGGGSGL